MTDLGVVRSTIDRTAWTRLMVGSSRPHMWCLAAHAMDVGVAGLACELHVGRGCGRCR
jgi:hypothetical protein